MKQGLQNEFLTVHMQHRIASHVNASGFSVSVGFLLRISSSSSGCERWHTNRCTSGNFHSLLSCSSVTGSIIMTEKRMKHRSTRFGRDQRFSKTKQGMKQLSRVFHTKTTWRSSGIFKQKIVKLKRSEGGRRPTERSVFEIFFFG